MTLLVGKILSGAVEAPDILVGGTPCQAFSVAGLRGSLADERGNLTLVLIRILDAIDFIRTRNGQPPCILVWENVPGVLNTKDNAFGCFLGGLAGESLPLEPAGKKWTNAGAVFGPAREIAWRILDAQYFRVRHLMPVECERLHGFPAGHTQIPWRGKPAADCPDNLRYKAIGNSMAVPVMRWIGARIKDFFNLKEM